MRILFCVRVVFVFVFRRYKKGCLPIAEGAAQQQRAEAAVGLALRQGETWRETLNQNARGKQPVLRGDALEESETTKREGLVAAPRVGG